MSLQEEIFKLVLELKNETNVAKKKKIKDKLKKLYLRIKGKTPRRAPKIGNIYKEEVETILKPVKQSIVTEKQKTSDLKKQINNEIKELEKQKEDIVTPEEEEAINLAIAEKQDEIAIINKSVEIGVPIEEVKKDINMTRELSEIDQLPQIALKLYQSHAGNEGWVKSAITRSIQKLISNGKFEEDVVPRGMSPQVLKEQKIFREKLRDQLFDSAKESYKEMLQLQEEERKQKQEEERQRKEAERQKKELQRQLREQEQLIQREQERRAAELFAQEEEDRRQGMERKEQEAEAQKKGIRKDFFYKPQAAGETVKPQIVNDFIDIKNKLDRGQIDDEEYESQKKEYAKQIALMTPEEQKEIRNYTVLTRDDTIDELLKTTKSLLREVAQKLPAFSNVNSPEYKKYVSIIDGMETQNVFGSFLTPEELGITIGQGKRKRKMKGGAGIADWMLTLGSIPGVPQLMNNMGPFGQVLGNASGLAQSFGKTAGQLIKEQSKDGEKVAGFTDILGGPFKSMLGFGKPPAIINKYNKHLLQGGSLKDFWNKHKNKLLAIGIPTATVLGALGSIAIGDKMIKDKNKALGIVEPVKATFFSRATPPPVEDLYTESSERPQLFNWDGTPSKDNLFGYDLSGRGANMADVAGGAFLSDFLGTLGGITPKISGLVGAIPTYGKVATIGNSVFGSASRVGEDIAKMLGLGNMDLTGTAPAGPRGYGNMDLTGKTKGFGKKKGGRKMIPHDRPIPRYEEGTAYIQPYGLQAEYPRDLQGGYSLTDMLYDTTGDFIKSGVKGLANAGANIVKDIAKTGVQKLADKAVQSIGNGRRKVKGKGKINGKYVSSEYEDNYENVIMKNNLIQNMQRMNAERQFEAHIQNQLNVEQQNALAQLQYYDLINKAQQFGRQ